MDRQMDAVERAFELARAGECRSVDDIKRRLSAEGHLTHRITGPTLLKQLRSLCRPKKPSDEPG